MNNNITVGMAVFLIIFDLNEFRDILQENGMVLSGTSPDSYIVETIEYADRDYFIGVQFHPEFLSRPNRPHPLFTGLLQYSLRRSEVSL